jgi:hypothetical protein
MQSPSEFLTPSLKCSRFLVQFQLGIFLPLFLKWQRNNHCSVLNCKWARKEILIIYYYSKLKEKVLHAEYPPYFSAINSNRVAPKVSETLNPKNKQGYSRAMPTPSYISTHKCVGRVHGLRIEHPYFLPEKNIKVYRPSQNRLNSNWTPKLRRKMRFCERTLRN